MPFEVDAKTVLSNLRLVLERAEHLLECLDAKDPAKTHYIGNVRTQLLNVRIYTAAFRNDPHYLSKITTWLRTTIVNGLTTRMEEVELCLKLYGNRDFY
jgi:hypothetical protein